MIETSASPAISKSLNRLAFRRFARNRLALSSFLFLLILFLVAIFVDWLAPQHFAEEDFLATYLQPGEEGFLLGTDFLGRDVWSRILYGARISLTVAICAALASFIIGVSYGLVAGYYGGKLDEWMMRFVDILNAVPTLLFVILIMVYFRAGNPDEFTGFKAIFYEWDSQLGGLLSIFIGIGLTSWVRLARIARAETLSLRRREFIEADLVQGFGVPTILFRRLFPNLLGTCIVAESVAIPDYIIFESVLSFIGLGVNPPVPSWGAMISEGLEGIRSYPHLILAPATAMTLTVLAFNFVGDGLRDAFDPKLQD
ncbi:MAG: ABC transporter permease [bacterium]